MRVFSGAATGSLGADEQGITLRADDGRVRTIPWGGIERIAGMRAVGFVGDTLMLVVQAEGRAQTLTDTLRGFHDAAAALSQCLPGAVDYRAWTAALTAQSPGVSITIYEAPQEQAWPSGAR